MSKYRKKPVVVEAIQWDGKNLVEISKFMKSRVTAEDFMSGEKQLLIYTLEGTMRASKNDWIIKGVDGEFYPCKPNIFEKTYEEVKVK